jgi:putative two-component system response regulator
MTTTPPPSSERILIVDDEDQIRTLLARLLGAHGYDCITAESAAAGRRALKETPIALVLSDVNMPGESGIDFTNEVLSQYPDTAVVMVTGMDDRRFAQIAIELGAYGYILKPFKPNELIINVGNALRRRALEMENRDHRERLEQTVLERTSALRDTIAQLETSDLELRRLREETIRRLSWAAEFRNQETGEHIVRMSLYCALLARLAGLDAERTEDIKSPARCTTSARSESPTGPPADRLTRTFAQSWRRTPRWATASSPLGRRAARPAMMALTHHERVDGTGAAAGSSATRSRSRARRYRRRLDALTSDRVYRRRSRSTRREMMEKGRHTVRRRLDLSLVVRRARDQALRRHRQRRADARARPGARHRATRA